MSKITKLMLLLFLICSFISCDPTDLPDVFVCVPDETMGTYCGMYSMKDLKFTEELKKEPASKNNGAFCIGQKSWLTKLKPTIKENYRVTRDSKKKKLEFGYEVRLRKFYEVH